MTSLVHGIYNWLLLIYNWLLLRLFILEWKMGQHSRWGKMCERYIYSLLFKTKYYFISCVYLKVRVKHTCREREMFKALVHSPDGGNGLRWTNPRTREFLQVSQVGASGLRPCAIFCFVRLGREPASVGDASTALSSSASYTRTLSQDLGKLKFLLNYILRKVCGSSENATKPITLLNIDLWLNIYQ